MERLFLVRDDWNCTRCDMRDIELLKQIFYYLPVVFAANLSYKEIVKERIGKDDRTNGIAPILVEQYVKIHIRERLWRNTFLHTLLIGSASDLLADRP